MKIFNYENLIFRLILIHVAVCLFPNTSSATTKTSIATGIWSDPSIWSPAGIPAAWDNITLSSGDTITVDATNRNVSNLTINSNAFLILSTGNIFQISGTIEIWGTLDMNNSDIDIMSPGQAFKLNDYSTFIYNPATNNSSNASLFQLTTKQFSSSSTLILRKWYDYTVPLSAVVDCDFGNLTINTPGSNGGIVEWDMKNTFESNPVLGTLTIDQGWVTLDKSGSIYSTNIGKILLTSVNSTFIGHNGTHPGSFTISTSSVTNYGGNFFGLSDGNGNVTVNVAGSFINSGNVKIINNTGVANVSNGNATFNVSGTYAQNTGDTRIIYNVSTTNSGLFTANFGSLNLTGGIFMGQTGCRTSGGTCDFTVQNNFTANFTANSNKFRGTSLSSIGLSVNNVNFNLLVNGNLSIAGPSASEFTSTSSAGDESITVNGDVNISGGMTNFNYGTAIVSHPLDLQVHGNMLISGGTTFLSRNGRIANIELAKNLTIHSGTFVIKGSVSPAILTLNGNFLQTGGYFFMHSNGSQSTPDSVKMVVNGNFSQSGGTINFDDNISSPACSHIIDLRGPAYTISGSGNITRGGAGSSSLFGFLRFNNSGQMTFQRNGNAHKIEQVVQTIENGTTLLVQSGNLQVASHNSTSFSFLEILPDGILQLGRKMIVKQNSFPNSRVLVDSAGTLSLSTVNGLFGRRRIGVAATDTLPDIEVDSNSVIEYTGNGVQALSADDTVDSTKQAHQYGTLRINLAGNPGDTVSLTANVTVRNRIELLNGILNLNGYSLTLMNGDPQAIFRDNSFIISENDSSFLVWKNIRSEVYEFPFGNSHSDYIPVYFKADCSVQPMTEVGISTRGTTQDNRPYPDIPGINMNTDGRDVSVPDIVDRFWTFKESGLHGDVSLTYSGDENTLRPEVVNGNLSIMNWEGGQWVDLVGSGAGITVGTGTVTVPDASRFGTWIVTSNSMSLPIELVKFNVLPTSNEVFLDWTTASEINVSFFSVERGTDGINFSAIDKVSGSGNSTILRNYSSIDYNPVKGLSYYRLITTNYNGTNHYSEIKAVNYTGEVQSDITIAQPSPNPFEDYFKLNYSIREDQPVQFNLFNEDGDIIYSKQEQGKSGSNIFEFRPQTYLAHGTYILRIYYKGKADSRKVIKK